MAKRFVRIEVDEEIMLIDLDRISVCEVIEADDGSEDYCIFDEKGQCVASFDVNDMAEVASAIEAASTEAARWEAFGTAGD